MTDLKNRLVIFDFFGVFCSDFIADWLAERGALQRGPQLIRDHVHPADLGEISFDAQCERFGKELGLTGPDVKAGFLAITRMDKDVVGIAERLARQCRLALLSNAPQGVVESVLARHGVALPFEIKIISGDVGLMKPDAAIYERVLQEARVAPRDAIMIDDRKINIDAAERLGIAGVVFTSADALAAKLATLGFDVG